MVGGEATSPRTSGVGRVSEESFVDFVLREWDQVASTIHSSSMNQNIKRDLEHDTAGIEIESRDFLVVVQIWEHAECLDVTVMEKNSGTSKMLSAGPCDRREEARRRLSQLAGRLASE
jgi:hypothetical protein